MPFSSVLGASSVIKPGVVTSSTRPSAPYVGQMIFETDTNRLAVYNGSSWIMLADADTPPGLELVKTQTIGTAVSSVTVSDVFSATYDNYRIVLNNTTGSTNLNLRLQLTGLTTTSYNNSSVYVNTSGTVTSSSGSSQTYFLVGGADTGSANSFSIDMFGPFTTSRTAISGMAPADNLTYILGGQAVDTNSRTGFSIATSTGTITGGTIRVYGYRNS